MLNRTNVYDIIKNIKVLIVVGIVYKYKNVNSYKIFGGTMDKIKVSICIAVYNGEKFLKRCLDTVVKQTLKEKEIIIVNDGSTDNSLKILTEYKKLYPEINLINLDRNKGISNARKVGVENARGQYIGFVDCDDYISLEMYEKMYNCAIENNVNIVECGLHCVNGEVKILKNFLKKKYSNYICTAKVQMPKRNPKKVLKSYFNSKSGFPVALWLRIYKRSLFDDKKIFPKFRVVSEDQFIFPCLLYKAKSIYYLKDILYFYCHDNLNSSIIKLNNNRENLYKNSKNLLLVIKHLQNFIGKNTIDKKYKKEFEYFKILLILKVFIRGINIKSINQIVKDINAAIK